LCARASTALAVPNRTSMISAGKSRDEWASYEIDTCITAAGTETFTLARLFADLENSAVFPRWTDRINGRGEGSNDNYESSDC
jgi:hypothetical protein